MEKAKNEEAVLNILKRFTNLTSNHHPGKMIYDAFARI